MRLKEFLNEWSNTSKNVIQYLQDKGYKLLGRGVDQSAFEEPNTGKVLKIFGAKKNKKSVANPGHIMFEVWHDYCQKNKSNPFLPKFSGWTYFDFENETYMQIRMERLIPINSNISFALEQLVDVLVRIKPGTYKSFKKFVLGQIGETQSAKYSYTSRFNNASEQFAIDPTYIDEISQLMIMIGKGDFELLLDTIFELIDICKSKGYEFDLHEGNFMHRHDGVPVIVDPWVTDSYRSVGKMSRGYK